jgi:hypothetical protein
MFINGTLEFFTDADYAEASISKNQHFRWAKFVLTDDKPNKNNQRIPKEEFYNLIRTGIYAPFKVARGQISDGHEFAEPIGVIAKLLQLDDKVIGLAALWPRERKDDVEYLEELHKSGNPLNVSWEILYTDSEIDDSGVENLKNVSLVGATIVGLPAYAGRTPVIAVASEANTKMEVDNMDDKEKAALNEQDPEQGTQTESEQNQEFIALSEYNALKAEYDALKSEYESLKANLETLQSAYAGEVRLKTIRQKFASVGINKPDSYFEENRERLLSLSDDAIDFMLQEMVAGLTKESGASVNLPPVVQAKQQLTKEEILEFLRKQISK